jgi:hypothetical protein
MANDDANTQANPTVAAWAAAYRHHATTLRNWLIAYGVGGPALFLTNDKLRDQLAGSGHLQTIGWTFLLGVLMQALMAFIDKYANWSGFQHASDPKRVQNWCSRRFAWWNDHNTPSIVLELASMLLFAVATALAFGCVFGVTPTPA